MIIRKDTDDDSEVSLSLHSQDLPWCDLCPDIDRVSVGYFGGESNVGSNRHISLYLNGVVHNTPYSLELGNAHFLVLRLTFLPNQTQVALFVDPSAGLDAPNNNPFVRNTTHPYLLRSLAYYGGGAPASSSIDEIRIGTAFDCVAPGTPSDLPPVANLSATPTSGTAPLQVDFDASASVANATGGLTFAWQFGDGATAGNSPTVSHTYAAPGTYNAIVTVSNSAGLSDQQAVVIVVNATLSPVAELFATPTSGTAPLQVDFDASASVANATGGLTFAFKSSEMVPPLATPLRFPIPIMRRAHLQCSSHRDQRCRAV
ncbi:MAG: PKD domain-containing protein [Saprospiraceae bacterium]